MLPTQRLARLAKQAGVKKIVLFGSYFAHFTEAWHDLNLKKENAYPRTRLLQEEVSFMEGEGEMDVPNYFRVLQRRRCLHVTNINLRYRLVWPCKSKNEQ